MAIFEKKIKRAFNWQAEKQKDVEKALNDDELESKIEKGDTSAMIISALIVLVPITLIVLAALAAAGYFFLIR